MFQPDEGRVATTIVREMLEELETLRPGFVRRVESRLNSALKSATDAERADAERAAEIVRAIET